ncbi:MAG: hypothetical protein HY833_00565 [Candidatus Aenigmarchaeota archaeon]|nr:hypothetical protein [Candidatus Aenigmarchaeota archaeon]
MVSKSVVSYKQDVIYGCGVCNYSFKYKSDAERCEATPVKKFKFEVGDKVELDTKDRDVAMVVRRYVRTMADSDFYNGDNCASFYEGGKYERPTSFGRAHQNRYSVYVNPEAMIRLASLKSASQDDKERVLKSLSKVFFASIDEREDDLKKIGRYDDSIIEKLKKLNNYVFNSKGENEF